LYRFILIAAVTLPILAHAHAPITDDLPSLSSLASFRFISELLNPLGKSSIGCGGNRLIAYKANTAKDCYANNFVTPPHMWGTPQADALQNITYKAAAAEVAGGIIVSGINSAINAARAGKVAAGSKSGTEVVQRAMSRAELAATESRGLLRGGRSGTHYVSDAVNSTAGRAQQRLALPQTPEVRVTLEVPSGRFSAPSRVPPKYNMPGGGMQRTASGDVPVRILRFDEY